MERFLVFITGGMEFAIPLVESKEIQVKPVTDIFYKSGNMKPVVKNAMGDFVAMVWFLVMHLAFPIINKNLR